MRKTVSTLIVVILAFLLLNIPLLVQSLDEKEKEKLYKEYLEKKLKSEESNIPKYKTPEIFEPTDSMVSVKRQTAVSIPPPVATVSPGIPKAGPDSLRVFGFAPIRMKERR